MYFPAKPVIHTEKDYTMKTVIVSLLMIVSSVFLYRPDVAAQSIYGSKINVDIPEYYLDSDWSGHLYPKYAKMYEAIYHYKNYPVWSPDSKWIVFTDETYGIWKVSVKGGKPILLYDNYDMHYWNGQLVTLKGLKPLCFTPDGSELTFVRNTINEEAGTEVEVDRDDNIVSIRYYYPVIESLNLETGEIRTIAESATSGYWSHDGRYFAYSYIIDLERPEPDLMVFDTKTGNDWSLHVTPESFCFTADDTHLIFVDENQPDTFLSVIPLEGGTPEDISGYFEEQNYWVRASAPDCSPDNEWVVSHGSVRYNEDGENRNVELFVYNTYTGDIIEIFPDENEPVIDPLKEVHQFYMPQWSPNGRQFCYVFNGIDYNYSVMAYELYLIDFDLESQRPTAVASTNPKDFTIIGNFPNPFNPSTTIQFSLPETGLVNLSVYNIMGQKVRLLVSDILNPGIHSVVWDGHDYNNNPVSAGIYFTRIEMNNYTVCSRMMLLK